MCWIIRTLTLFLVSVCLITAGALPVLAEDETIPVEEEITVPVEGVTMFKYSPAGFQLTQPDGITSTVSEFDVVQLIVFLNEEQSFLTVDVTASNETLEDAVAAQKVKMEEKPDYALISEEDTTLGGVPAVKVTFSYTDEIETEKTTEAIIVVNEGYQYVLMSDADADAETAALITDMVDTFEFIPVGEDNISKMVKTKMKQMEEPDKGFRWSSYSYNTYHYYSWGYAYDWYSYIRTPTLGYYCWCW